ncbi:hypothetical protein [Seonamhaeicola marinus]|uniref:Uncharacterized protein n=1 Tax=Seonamhaeicola marinus TaxID=1912246 RepID=A0A5D0HTP0_9FLAO|nr:hypothetical protein [Seonamhaeicola marinus]TYA74724.1 hypothetical protein FUA24_15540 [Seonamhaeicola marinus]
MDSKIISEGMKPEILELLHQGKFEAVFPKIEKKKKRIFDFMKASKEETHFTYEILPSFLNKTVEPIEYSKVAKLNFKSDFVIELIELHRILLVLQDYSKAPEIEKLVSFTLLECIRDGAIYIEENSNNYPQNSINGKIWIDGAGLRIRADELSEYFKSKEDDQNTLETVFLRAKLTNTIMSHYPNLVGPDMIAVALQFEKMGNLDKAKQFLTPVVQDFTSLVQDVEEGIDENEVMDEDFPITESLIQALEGLKRLGENINEDTLNKSKEVLEKLKKATNKVYKK